MSARIIFALFFLSSTAAAQSDLQVPTIAVIGAAKDKSAVTPQSEIAGQKLRRKQQNSVGETLSRESGLSSTQFGPNSSRPVSRGQEGDRTRVLQNGTGVLDASTASEDHAVATDPLSIERVEIVRGPGALVYGPSVMGGVVNLITNRIPEALPAATSATVLLKGASNEGLRSGGVGLETGVGPVAIHLDGSLRAADDYEGPDQKRVVNSFNLTGSGAFGASYVFDRGFLGASFSDYESQYGTVAEETVHINLLQRRLDAAGEIRDFAGFQTVRFKNSYSNYKHDEMESGSRATTFKNDGNEFRLEMKHGPSLGWNGVIGLESRTFDFSADGEEKFLPSTSNQTHAFFVHEEYGLNVRPSFALRLESVESESKDNDGTFTAQTKTFSPFNLALGLKQTLDSGWGWSVSGAYTERAPNYQELYANGPHVVMESEEKGDANLKKERAQSLEAGVKYSGESSSAGVTAFLQDAKDYIVLAPTGVMGAEFEISEYRGVEARLWGAEFEAKSLLLSKFAGGTLEGELKVDMLNALNRQTGDRLPRITPIRESIGLNYQSDRWQADLEIQRSERQRHLAPNESKTSDFTLVNLGVEVPHRIGSSLLNFTARVHNVFDIEARNHVSRLKDIAPLPGRNFIVGVQGTF